MGFREGFQRFVREVGEELVHKFHQGRDELGKAILHNHDPYLPWPDNQTNNIHLADAPKIEPTLAASISHGIDGEIMPPERGSVAPAKQLETPVIDNDPPSYTPVIRPGIERDNGQSLGR